MGETMGPSPEEMGLRPEPKIDLEGGQQVPKPEFNKIDPELKSIVQSRAGEFVEGVMGSDVEGNLYEDRVKAQEMERILRILELSLGSSLKDTIDHEEIVRAQRNPDYQSTTKVMDNFIQAARERLKGPKTSE
ncbi:MAG: hypothetical protein Q8P13_04910 [bacterium]|nr:hypothetical protein [bacterium]